MSWFMKIAIPIRTQDLPEILANAIAYECGGEWKADKATAWTEDLEKITGDKRLGQEVGYSSSFWISCQAGDGYFQQKWGVSVNFTVTSGSSNTVFDSQTGDWDLSITANVQWAAPASWTRQHPYALLIRTVGHQEDMKTIQEVASFVKQSIWNDQQDDDDGEDDGGSFEDDPTPDPSIDADDPSFVGSPQLVLSTNWFKKLCSSEDNASHYFSIGHGDYNEQLGFEPKYIVWVYWNGKIDVGPIGMGETEETENDAQHGGTHGILWGHELSNKTYKGRYEPETGRLSIVKPAGKEMFPIPQIVMDALREKFDNIREVIEF